MARKTKLKLSEEIPAEKITTQIPESKPKIQTAAFGASGTEIYSGYIHEEYLQDLTGSQRATEFDRMRRSDAIVKMLLSAMKLPIKGANWYFKPIDENSEEAKLQKKFFDYVFFEDFGQSFTKWIGEVLSCIDQGYSLFEIIHKVNVDSKIGPHIGFKKVAFRSQKTIERWNVDEFGDLISVDQQASGDNSKTGLMTMKGEFLVHFCPEQEGDDFEGLAVLRSCYGAYKRKNLFLKLIAAGVEKYAFKTPMATVPAGHEESSEKAALEMVLKKYVSNQSNYIIKPEGWTIEMVGDQFDSEEVRKNVTEENMEMVNSVLAAFLLLGQGGSGGSRALSQDLSTFFGASIQFIADHIGEVITTRLVKTLLKLNFPDQDLMVELCCDSLKDDADQTFANILKTLKDGSILTPDNDLEKFVREKYKLPAKAEIDGEEQIKTDTKEALNGAQVTSLLEVVARVTSGQISKEMAIKIIQMAFNLSPEIAADLLADAAEGSIPAQVPEQKMFSEEFQKKDVERALRLMTKTQAQLESLFEENMNQYAIDLIDRLVKNFETLPEKSKHSGIQGVEKSLSKDYVDAVIDVAASSSREAASQLTQFKNEVKFAEIDDLPRSVKNRIKNKIIYLLTTQKQDLEKAIILQYQSSVDSTDSAAIVKKDLLDSYKKTIDSVKSKGASVLSNDIVNSARLDAIPDESVESWTFIAEMDDATTDACRAMNNRTFSTDDPDLERYRPPLHFNCRSILVPNKKHYKGNPEITTKPLALSAKALEQIQFTEEGKFVECGCGNEH